MGMSRPNQQLRRELLDIASQADEAAYMVGQVAKSLPVDQVLMLMCALGLIYESVDRAVALADRVKAGEVVAT